MFKSGFHYSEQYLLLLGAQREGKYLIIRVDDKEHRFLEAPYKDGGMIYLDENTSVEVCPTCQQTIVKRKE